MKQISKQIISVHSFGLVYKAVSDAPPVCEPEVVREIMSEYDDYDEALYNADSRRRRHLDYVCDEKSWVAHARRVSKPKLVK